MGELIRVTCNSWSTRVASAPNRRLEMTGTTIIEILGYLWAKITIMEIVWSPKMHIYASNKFSYKQHQWRFNSAYPQLYWLTSPLCVVKPISSTKFLLLKPLKPAFLPWWNPYFSLSPLHLAQLHDGIQRLLPHRDHVRVHVDTSVVPEKFQAQDVGFALPHLLFHVDPKTNLTKRRCIPWNEKMGRFLFHIIQCEAPQWC